MIKSVMYMLLILLLIQVTEETATSCANTTATGETKPLYLLTLVPLSHKTGWERSLSGTCTARDEINNHTDFLPGYHIELIIENIETCSHTSAGVGLSNLVKYTVSPPCRPVVAVTGLLCSSHTLLLSPVAGHDGYDLIQLTAANSPIFQTQNHRFPHLWQLFGSATLYTDTVLAIMDQYNWTRVGVVYDTTSDFYVHVMEHLVQTITASENKSVVFSNGMSNKLYTLPSTIQRKEVNILVTVLDPNQATTVQLLAQNEMLINVVWIHIKTLMYTQQPNKTHNYTYQNCFILQLQTECAPKYRTTKLYHTSGFNEDQQNVFNLVLHDQLWTLALAINKSLPELKIRNLSIDNYNIGQNEITRVIEQQLANLSFQGASGWIEFNQYRSVSSPVEISWVFRNGSGKIVGVYNPLKPLDFRVHLGDLSSHTQLSNQMSYMSLPMAILLYILSGAVIMFTTVQLILYFHYRHHKVIKATSPYLSLLIFLGCYLLCLAAVCMITIQSMVIPCQVVVIIYYALILLFENGIGFILLTLFVRLLRIYWIFSKWMKKDLGKCLNDLHLILVVFLLILIPNVISIVRFGMGIHLHYYECTLDDNTFEVTIDVGLSLGCLLVYILMVIILGILNRNIKHKHFNDACQIYLLITVVLLILFLTLSFYIIYALRMEVIIAESILPTGLLIFDLVCQMILFLPKIAQVVMKKS